jgi:thiol-disulfide isomerase/thioredoxin
MLERLLIALALIGIGFALYRVFVAVQLSRANNTLPGLEGRESGKFLILYFTSPTCEPCRTAQRPALQTAQKAFGEQLQVITVDITEQPEIAAAWHVMTLPTTYLFDLRGTSRNYNPGVAYADKLIQQIKNMGAKA